MMGMMANMEVDSTCDFMADSLLPLVLGGIYSLIMLPWIINDN